MPHTTPQMDLLTEHIYTFTYNSSKLSKPHQSYSNTVCHVSQIKDHVNMVFSFNAFQLRASVRSEFPAHLLTWEGMTGHYAHTNRVLRKTRLPACPRQAKDNTGQLMWEKNSVSTGSHRFVSLCRSPQLGHGLHICKDCPFLQRSKYGLELYISRAVYQQSCISLATGSYIGPLELFLAKGSKNLLIVQVWPQPPDHHHHGHESPGQCDTII